MISVESKTARILVYSMTATLIVAFGAIGAVLLANLGPQFSLLGVLIGSSFGAFIAVYESTVIGCICGMLIGITASPIIYALIDIETTCLAVFFLSILGAILGEPISHFWQESIVYDSEEQETSKSDTESRSIE